MFGVIFDMDGTLLDTQREAIPAWNYSGEKQNIPHVGEHVPFVCGMNDAGSNAYLQKHFPSLHVRQFKQDAMEYLQKHLSIRLKSGALELLEYLKSENIPLAIASGTKQTLVEYCLQCVNVSAFFDVIVGGDHVGRGKPAPDIFLLAAEKLGVAPQNCVVFEDSVNGIKAAVAAGMRCVGVPDMVAFDAQTKTLLWNEVSSLDQAILLLKKENRRNENEEKI